MYRLDHLDSLMSIASIKLNDEQQIVLYVILYLYKGNLSHCFGNYIISICSIRSSTLNQKLCHLDSEFSLINLNGLREV